MNMGYPCTNDYGRRINELLSLRILEFMFDPSKSDDATGVGVAESRVEFDLSLSNTDVLKAICEDIPISSLRTGMPELSKFNVLPFIAHKNMSLPQCALEKLRDVSLMENQTSAAPPMEANDPLVRDDGTLHTDVCEEKPVDEQQVQIGLEQTNINDKGKAILIDDKDDPMQTNEKDEENAIDTGGTFPLSCKRMRLEDTRVKCTKDGTWLISGSDEESDMVRGRAENVCWKCEKEGTLLICCRSECAARVHRECLNSPVNLDEDGNFHCPLCWYNRVTMEYLECQELMSCAKRRLAKFLPLLSRASKRLRR
ncbi:hypothetical protein EUTSA_v10011681mg [Eutrema salsugineum]|uniref:PHD-type domain-containing protein n=3 Tax=Eutrema salsugineum TaxID=72664 RepID=V4MF32_EUTSA|nr:hypothetical protein EUTSA_v10011681mg [Eutrema salsugineum]